MARRSAARRARAPALRPASPRSRRSWARESRALSEALLEVREAQCFDQRPDVAVEKSDQIVRRPADAMIGDATLRKVVGPNLFRPVAAADLRLAHARSRLLLLGDLAIQ